MRHSDLELLYEVMSDKCGFLFLSMHRRLPYIVEQKQMFALIARHYGASMETISRFVGWKGTGGSSVISAVRRMQGYMDVYPEYKWQFNAICEEYEYRKAAGILFQPD
jgi:hypothetical protein